MMKKFLLGSVALIALVGAAAAADMPTKAPAMYAPFAYNWTGPYVGLNAGGGWIRDTGTNHNGGLIGGTIGYNFQAAGPWVWGLEGDLDYFSNRDQKYLGTVRGRLGYATDRWLPYLTGGLAVMNDNGRAYAGWTLGAGVEYAILRNTSVKLEYLYVDPRGSTVRGSVARVGLNWRF
jgi:outer membrane immunogenic protein